MPMLKEHTHRRFADLFPFSNNCKIMVVKAEIFNLCQKVKGDFLVLNVQVGRNGNDQNAKRKAMI